jgi:hypothetical protein
MGGALADISMIEKEKERQRVMNSCTTKFTMLLNKIFQDYFGIVNP